MVHTEPRVIPVPNLKGLAVALLVIFTLAVLSVGAIVLLDEIGNRRQDVRIMPWSPAEESPYVCFAAVRGGNEVLGLDCLEKRSPLTPPQIP